MIDGPDKLEAVARQRETLRCLIIAKETANNYFTRAAILKTFGLSAEKELAAYEAAAEIAKKIENDAANKERGDG